MWSGMPAWADEVLRGPHVQFGFVQAINRGQFVIADVEPGFRWGLPAVAHPDPSWLPMDDGDVQVTGGDVPGVRRALSVTLARIPGLYDALSSPGVELLAYSVITDLSGALTATIPQGVFPVDVTKMGYGPAGTIEIASIPDRWSRVQQQRFFTPRPSMNGATARQQLATLLLEVMPVGSTVTDVATSTATVPAQTWDRDRDQAVQSVAQAASIDALFDRAGMPLIRDTPTLSWTPVWTVDADPDVGVLLDASRQRDRTKTFNVIVVDAQAANGEKLFDPVIVWDNDPNSPTYAGPDPVNHPELAGPLGVRPKFYSSPLITSVVQAYSAGLTILGQVTALESQLTLTTSPHPGLDDGDTISVVLPPEQDDMAPAVELHIIDSFNVPLRPDKGNSQSITTRSTRPDTVQDS